LAADPPVARTNPAKVRHCARGVTTGAQTDRFETAVVNHPPRTDDDPQRPWQPAEV
jgi:hypothetical protein